MLKKLSWDSQYWEKEIYNADNIADIPADNKAELIQCLIPCHDVNQINLACSKGFKFIQGKVTLEKPIKNNKEIDKKYFKPLKLDELEIHKDIFYDMYGAYTRHPMFSKQKINDYYYCWIANTIKGQLDDECISYYIGNEAAGFITYKKKGDTLVIGLVGVFPKFQRRGLSQKLLNYADYYAFKNGCKTISVATQDSNITAINAYIKHGYNIGTIDYWFYKIRF